MGNQSYRQINLWTINFETHFVTVNLIFNKHVFPKFIKKDILFCPPTEPKIFKELYFFPLSHSKLRNKVEHSLISYQPPICFDAFRAPFRWQNYQIHATFNNLCQFKKYYIMIYLHIRWSHHRHNDLCNFLAANPVMLKQSCLLRIQWKLQV